MPPASEGRVAGEGRAGLSKVQGRQARPWGYTPVLVSWSLVRAVEARWGPPELDRSSGPEKLPPVPGGRSGGELTCREGRVWVWASLMGGGPCQGQVAPCISPRSEGCPSKPVALATLPLLPRQGQGQAQVTAGSPLCPHTGSSCSLAARVQAPTRPLLLWVLSDRRRTVGSPAEGSESSLRWHHCRWLSPVEGQGSGKPAAQGCDPTGRARWGRSRGLRARALALSGPQGRPVSHKSAPPT